MVDFSILFIAVAEGVSYATSTYRENSFYSAADISFFILFFYWIRFNLKYHYQRIAMYIFFSILGVLISISGILNFLSSYFRMKAAGFSNVSDLRHIFYFGSPSGSPTGEWITLYLALLPFSLIVLFEKFKNDNRESLLLFIPPILILIILVCSCSRGMYLAIASFAFFGSALFLWYKLSSLKKVILFNAIFLISLGFVIVTSPLFKPVVTTLSLFQTTSQVRSFEGRKSIWKSGIEMIKDYPFSGIGTDNFPIMYVTYKIQHDDTPFVGRVFNFFLQLTIEKGLVGLIAYCFLIITFFFISHHKIILLHNDWNQQVVIVLFISAYAAIILRDLTYSSLFSNKGVHLLLWFMLAHNALLPKDEIIEIPIHFERASELQATLTNYRRKTIAIIPIFIASLIFLAITIHAIRKENAELLLLSFVDQINHRKFIEAQQSIEDATHLSPNNAYYWACRGLLAERKLQQTSNLEKILTGDFVWNEKELEQMKTAVASYRKALELNPADDLFYHNLGWLYIFTKDEKQAEFCFHHAIQLDRKSAIYHVSLGFLKEKEGKKDSAMKEYGSAVYQLPSLLDSPFFSSLKKRMPMDSKQLVMNTIQVLEKEFQQRDDPTAAARLAKLYYFQGEKQKAIFLLERVTKELPSLSRPWLYFGDLYQSCNKDSEMIQCYQKSGFLDMSDIFPFLRLGQYYDQRNQWSEAIYYYRKYCMFFLFNVLFMRVELHVCIVQMTRMKDVW